MSQEPRKRSKLVTLGRVGLAAALELDRYAFAPRGTSRLAIMAVLGPISGIVGLVALRVGLALASRVPASSGG